MQDEQMKPEPTNVQKMKWSVAARFPTFEKADQFRSEFTLAEGQKIKVHRMGEDGTIFAVKVGSPFQPKDSDAQEADDDFPIHNKPKKRKKPRRSKK